MKIITCFILLTIFSCKPSESDSKSEVEFNHIDSLYLKKFRGNETKYSLLIFGMGYFNSKLRVENCRILEAEDSTKTIEIGPFAKIYRIENSCDAKIADAKRQLNLEIDKDSIRKYKFIYLERNFETDSLIINYRNNHISVK